MANLSNINNKFIVTDGNNGRVLIGATNDIGATLFANHPSTTAPSLTFNAPAGQVFENEDLQIAFGLNNASPYNAYMQTRFVSAPFHRNLAINPLGGDVGIGTNSPEQKLHVEGASITVNRGNDDSSIAFQNSTSNATWRIGRDYSNSEALTFAYSATDYPSLTGSGLIYIDTSGNVGIGTSSPGASLDIEPSSGDADILLTAGSQTLRLDQNSIRTTTNNNLTLFTNGNSGQLVLQQSTGNVGIGTASPSKKLEVAGSYKLGTNAYIEYGNVYPYTISILNTAGVGNLIFNAGAGSSGYESKIELQGGNTAGTAGITLSTGSSPRIVVTADGNVGIGYTNPVYKLQLISTKTVATNIGMYSSAQGASTSNYSFYADANGATNNWAFYAASGNSYFANGIRLGGNGSSNELDDYEEGTWTPTSNLPGATVSSYGKYTKIGNIVYIAGKIEFTGKTGTAVNVVIDSLPFSGSNTSDTQTRPSAFPEGDLVNMATLVNDYGHFRLNSNQMQGVIVNSSGNTIYMSSNNFSSSGQFNFSVVYTAT